MKFHIYRHRAPMAPFSPGFLLLFVMWFCLVPLAGAKETEVTIHTDSMRTPTWEGMRLGIARIEFKGKSPYSSYVLEGRGLHDQLIQGEEPLAQLRRCTAADYPPGLFNTLRQATPRNGCLRLLVLWGDFLVESPLGRRLELEDLEKARGWRFLQQGFQLLLEDLKGISDLQERTAKMELVHSLDFRVINIMGIRNVPAVVRSAALQYYSQVWDSLPQTPNTYDLFMLKFATGEELKQFYFGNVLDESTLEPTLAASALRFYEQAERFHKVLAPMPPAAKLPRVVPAILRHGMRGNGIGYAVFPGETALRPLTVLAHTDLEENQILLQRMLAAGQITQAELESRIKALAAEDGRLNFADLTLWLDIAAKQRDLQEEMVLRTKLVALYRDLDDKATAEQLLEKVCAQARELGDLPTWASRTLDLVTYKIVREQWAAALGLIQELKPVVTDELLLNELTRALQYERLVREKLQMAPVDYDAADRLAGSFADLPDPKEPDLARRIANSRAYSQKPNLPPVLRMTTLMLLANTLKETGQAAEAEEIIKNLRPEVKRWRGLPGELNLLEGLLTLQVGRGNFGGFYATLSQYKEVSAKLHGDNWLTLNGLDMADIFFKLQDYHEAESLLEEQRRSDYMDSLHNPISMRYLEDGDVPLSDDALVLEARIQMELGQKDQALRELRALDASTSQVGEKRAVETTALEPKKRALLALAEIYAALGQSQVALDRVTKLLSALDPLAETNLWARAMVQQGQLLLAAGQSTDALVATMENLVPHAAEQHELEATAVVEMDMFLGDVYTAQKKFPLAAQRFHRGLDLAEKSGAVDQQIILHRKLGELAARGNDAQTAAGQYRLSIVLLKNVSTNIPSDLGKVGYRAERSKAIPLLVVTLYALYQQSHDQKYLDEMFGVIEEGKSRALAEMLTKAGGSLPSDLKTIQQSLPPGSSLLEFYLPEGVSDEVFRLVIDRGSIVVDVLGANSGQMSQGIEALLKAVKEPGQFDEASFKAQAARMGKLLLPASWLSAAGSEAVRKVFIVPAGILHLFPFSLLVDGHGHYLDEDQTLDLAYLPNASVLTRSVPRFADASRSAGFVNPALDADHHEALLGAGELRGSLTDAFRRWSGGDIQWEQPVSGPQFLLQAAKTDNVFLYTHGRFLPYDPTGSYVHFADEAGKVTDVSAAQLLASKVGNGLWVLAACSSGVTTIRSGDEALGLPRALLVAGASMVVISLWDIDATSSFDIMSRFYKNLADGLPVAQALHRASAALRRDGSPPYDWAPFILIGHHGFENDRR